MYKSKKPKKESPALKFIREQREKQWEEIIKNGKAAEKSVGSQSYIE